MPTDFYDPGREGYQLSSWLDLYVQNFESDYRKYWGLDQDSCPEWLLHEHWILARKVDVSFPSIIEGAHALALSPEFDAIAQELAPSDNPLLSASSVSRSDVVLDRLEIDLAYEALGNWVEARKRFSLLLLLLGKTRISERGSLYLQRATKLYLWNFELECLVMCSSVLEAVLEQELSETDLTTFGLEKRKGQRDWEFWQLIEGATKAGLISKDQKKRANALRIGRNQMLHELPASDSQALRALFHLADILASIYPSREKLWTLQEP